MRRPIPRSKKWYRDFTLKLLLVAFIIVASGLGELGLMQPLGILLAFVFMFKGALTISEVMKDYPLGLKLLNLWVLWAFFTGFFVAKDMQFFLDDILTVFTTVLAVNFIYVLLTYKMKLIGYVAVALILGAFLQIASVYFGFQPVEITKHVASTGRQYGLTRNPNLYGLLLLYSTMALLFLASQWKVKIGIAKWGATVLIFLLMMVGVLASGSRKSLLTFFFFVAGFIGIYFVQKKRKLNFFVSILAVVLVGVALYLVVPEIVQGTDVGHRLMMSTFSGDLTSGDADRVQMYEYGWGHLFPNHPIFGVGLNNFRVHFYLGIYSHSDYTESIASTGLVGFVLYQLFFFIPLIKALRLLKTTVKKNIRFNLLFCILIILCLKAVAFGIILYYSPAVMFIMACIVAYVQKVKRDAKEEALRLQTDIST